MKRARTNSTDEDDVDWKKPRTMAENLRGSKDLLSCALAELSQSVAVLDSLTPKVSRLSSLAQLERKYEMVTLKDIEEARKVVVDSTRPETERLLTEAQFLIDQKVLLFSQLEQKVDVQDNTLTTHDPIPENLSTQDKINTKKQDKRQRHTLLSVQDNKCDAKLAEMNLELNRLDEKVKRKQIQQKGGSEDGKQQKDSAQEERLVNQLKQLEEQLERKRRIEATESSNKDTEMDALLDIDMIFSDLAPDAFQQRLSFMQELLKELQGSKAYIKPKRNDLRPYRQAIEQYQAKYNQSIQLDQKPARLEEKVENSIGLLKTYCKTLMLQENMGYIAQRLIDMLFTKDGYSAMTKDQIVQKFGSSRQKQVVTKLLDILDLSFIQ